jgi:hypothetical protein
MYTGAKFAYAYLEDIIKKFISVLVTCLGALLNKRLSGQSWDHSPYKHNNYTVGTALSYSPPQPLLFEIKLSTASIG